jgi:hypothetical protein
MTTLLNPVAEVLMERDFTLLVKILEDSLADQVCARAASKHLLLPVMCPLLSCNWTFSHIRPSNNKINQQLCSQRMRTTGLF